MARAWEAAMSRRSDPPLSFASVHRFTCLSSLSLIHLTLLSAVPVRRLPKRGISARRRKIRELNDDEEARDELSEYYGIWQVEDFKPGRAEVHFSTEVGPTLLIQQNGIVPKNKFGNVTLYKPEMLPYGTRYLNLENLTRVARRLNIDCPAAMVCLMHSKG